MNTNLHKQSLGHTLIKKLTYEAARPAVIREHPWAPWFIVATVCFGAFMGQLDASIVTLAFPTLQRQFHTPLASVEWISLAYLITLVALLVPVGKLSDRHGRKLVYLYGFVVFTAASAACGLAPSLFILILFRVIQAAGASMLQANSVALVATNAPAGHKRAALGIQAAAQSLGLALGPLLGGILIAATSWRWIFFINVPVGILAVIAGWYMLPRTHERAPSAPSDRPGLALLAIAVISTLVLVSSVSGLSLSMPQLAGIAVLSVISFMGLVWREHHAPAPMIDIKMLKSSGIAHMLFGAMFAYMVLFGPLVLFPQILDANGKSVLRAGLLLSALPAGFGLAAVGTERMFPRRWKDKTRTRIGGILATVSAGLLAIPAPDIVTVILLGTLGIGLGIYIPANNATIMSSVTKHQTAAAGGLVNIARGLGTAFGVAVVALALHATMHVHSSAGLEAAMVLLTITALAATWAGHRTNSHAVQPGVREHVEIEAL